MTKLRDRANLIAGFVGRLEPGQTGRAGSYLREGSKPDRGPARIVPRLGLWHNGPMSTALLLISSITVIAVIVGGIVAYLGVRSAPDGYEGASGFNAISS